VGMRFSAPVQTGPGVHPTSSTMGTGSFPEVKRPGRDIDHPTHLPRRFKIQQYFTVLAIYAVMADSKATFTFNLAFMCLSYSRVF